MTPKHTPTPWKVFENEDSTELTLVCPQNWPVKGDLIARVNIEANALLICKAVNEREELLAALKRVTSQYEAFVTQAKLENDPFHKRLDKDVRQVLAKAEAI